LIRAFIIASVLLLGFHHKITRSTTSFAAQTLNFVVILYFFYGILNHNAAFMLAFGFKGTFVIPTIKSLSWQLSLATLLAKTF